MPKALATTRLYYRTVPLKYTRCHLPFWRAKGYLKLNGKTRLALATWREPLEYNPFAVIMSNGNETVKVQADYVLV